MCCLLLHLNVSVLLKGQVSNGQKSSLSLETGISLATLAYQSAYGHVCVRAHTCTHTHAHAPVVPYMKESCVFLSTIYVRSHFGEYLGSMVRKRDN